MPFPYSGAPGEKLRPALVLATWRVGRIDDCLVCMITSQATGDPFAISVTPAESGGSLRLTSYIRPVYLYATGETRIRRKIGAVDIATTLRVLKKLRGVLS